MIKVFGVLVGFILSFVAGYFYHGFDRSDLKQLNAKITQLQIEKTTLAQSNKNINDTLALIKRQIQTDRIAYQALQDTITMSEQSRAKLQSQLIDQQKILKTLRHRLE